MDGANKTSTTRLCRLYKVESILSCGYGNLPPTQGRGIYHGYEQNRLPIDWLVNIQYSNMFSSLAGFTHCLLKKLPEFLLLLPIRTNEYNIVPMYLMKHSCHNRAVKLLDTKLFWRRKFSLKSAVAEIR